LANYIAYNVVGLFEVTTVCNYYLPEVRITVLQYYNYSFHFLLTSLFTANGRRNKIWKKYVVLGHLAFIYRHDARGLHDTVVFFYYSAQMKTFFPT